MMELNKTAIRRGFIPALFYGYRHFALAQREKANNESIPEYIASLSDRVVFVISPSGRHELMVALFLFDED
jgi:hypothetical protein